MRNIFRNSFSVWLKRFLYRLFTLYENRSNRLIIGSGSSVKDVRFGVSNYIYDRCIVSSSSLGNFTYIASGSIVTKVKIGSFCSIGPECRIGLGMHPTRDFVSTHPAFFSTLKQSGVTFSDEDYFEEFASISIGNDVWLGSRVTVVDGVSIGDGAVIGAGAVVTKNVPPYAVVGGVPAQVLRYRFSDEDISFLLKIKWWEWEIEFLRSNFKSFHSIKSLKKLVDVSARQE